MPSALTWNPELFILWRALSAIVKVWCVCMGFLFVYPAGVWFLWGEESCTLYIAEYPAPKTVPGCGQMNGYQANEGDKEGQVMGWIKERWGTLPDVCSSPVVEQTMWTRAFKSKQSIWHLVLLPWSILCLGDDCCYLCRRREPVLLPPTSYSYC